MKLNKIIQRIAREYHTTPEIIRTEMEKAMEEAKRSTNPAVQAR